MLHTRRQFMHHIGCASALGALSPLAAWAQTIDQVKIFYGFPAGSAGALRGVHRAAAFRSLHAGWCWSSRNCGGLAADGVHIGGGRATSPFPPSVVVQD